MPPEDADHDLALLVDMLAAARECASYVQQVDFATFEQDRMRVRAVERMLEIIGEAARGCRTRCATSFPRRPGGSSLGNATSSRMSTTRLTTSDYGTSLAID